jgi:hypothetical protein
MTRKSICALSDYREDYRRRNDEYDEDGNRYYNDRDFRREQQLEDSDHHHDNVNCYDCMLLDFRVAHDAKVHLRFVCYVCES